MTKPFTKLYSDFWINFDNSEIISLGLDAQLMALYLQGNSHHNMLGVYYLPLLYIASDLKLPIKKVRATLEKLCKINYCKHDEKTQYVWIYNLAFEQIGETIDERDNRIKALHAIWESLPSKLEFLEEIYQKYSTAFHFTPRVFEKPSKTSEVKEINEIKIELAVADVSSGTNINKNTNIPASTNTATATNSDVYISKDIQSSNSNINTNIQSSIEVLPLVPIFETPLEFPDNRPEVVTTAAVFENSLLVTPSIGFMSPFKGASKPLASPSEAPSDALRSNIEDISKNIKEINKKKEIEKDLKKIETEENKETNNALSSNSVVQARPNFEKTLGFFNSSFLKITKDLEETEKTEAVDAKKQLIAHKPCNLPVVILASELKTNPASVFPISSVPAVIPVIPITRNNSVVPVIHTGSVVNASADAITTIFEHWKTTMNYPESKLDYDRSSWIRKALRGYSVQKLCDAITGCSLTPHNRGDNDQGERYDDLHVIFKNAAQIDRFLRNFHHPPQKETEAEKLSRKIIQSTKEWAASKVNKSTENSFSRSNYV